MSDFLFTQNLGRATDYGLCFFPDKPALVQAGMRLTYKQLDRRINRVAQGLSAAGLRRGDRVLILWENDLRFVETALGAIRGGFVAVPVNPKLAVQTHQEQLEDSGALAVLGSAAAGEIVSKLAQHNPLMLSVAVDGEAHGLVDYEGWLSNVSPASPDVLVDPDELAWLAFTSGTTGRPKGVQIPGRMLLRDSQLIGQNLYLNPSDRVVLAAPLFHMNAAACGLLPVLLTGGTVTVLPGFEPQMVLRTISEQHITYSIGVPAMFKMMLAEADNLSDQNYRSLRVIACGSAPLPPSLSAQLSGVFPNATFVEGYGLTECGPCLSMNPLIGPRRAGSIGRPLPGFEVRIVGSDEEDIPPGGTGELWCRNAYCVTPGYLGRPEENARRIKPGGWFATGDLAYQDDDGWLYFRGRADDRINVGGEKVYPAEVEAILARHAAVRDVAVVPSPHEVKGQVPVAFVVLETGAKTTEEELREYFFAEGPAYAHPRCITFLDQMPLSATAKTDKRALSRDARSGKL